MSEAPRYHYLGTADASGAFTPTDSVAWFDIGDWIGGEVGYALNLDARWAAGISASVETGNETTRLAVRARARRWLSPRLYAETLAGVVRQRRDLLYRSGDALQDNTGWSAEARIGLAGLLFLSARYDVVSVEPLQVSLGSPGRYRRDPGGTARAFSLGGGLEGRTAIVTSAAALLIGVGLRLVFGPPSN
jgi:hypothetical protein